MHQRRTASSWNRRCQVIYNCKLFSLGLRDEQRRAIWPLPRSVCPLTLAFAYLSFIAAERLLHVSGVVAVLGAGLTFSALGPSRITPENWSFLSELWEQIAFWARSLIFLLASILVPRLLADVGLHDIVLLSVLIAAAFGARAFALFVLLSPMERLRLTPRIDLNYKLAIIWGGLRGALTLVLALAITEHSSLPPNIQRFVAVLATGFVLFTLFVNGTTLRLAIRPLGLDRLSARDEALRDHIQALSYADARDAAREIGRTHALSQTAVDRVIGPYQAKLEAAQAHQDAAARNLAEADQLAIALVSLANQERVLIIDMLREGVLSPGAAHVMLSNAEALAEAARSDGRAGYGRASEATLDHSVGFRVALFFYRRLTILRPLAERLAERLEILLAMRIALGRLAVFNGQQISRLFGKHIAIATHEIVSGRQQAIENALDALRRQYPDYLTELEVRFLTQSTLHHEMGRYQSLFEEGLISRELYDDLTRNTLGAGSPSRRPHFDIGLHTHKLVKCLDLLASLDERQLEIVCGLLRPHFTIPHERIIRKGDPGDGVYFIASGSVEVILPDRRIQIGPGAFSEKWPCYRVESDKLTWLRLHIANFWCCAGRILSNSCGKTRTQGQRSCASPKRDGHFQQIEERLICACSFPNWQSRRAHALSCQLGLMIDGIIIEIVTLGGMVDSVEERRKDCKRGVANARLPIRLAPDAPYRNAQTKMLRVASAHCLADEFNNDVEQLFDRNGRARGFGR